MSAGPEAGRGGAQPRWLLLAAGCALGLGVLLRVLAAWRMDLWQEGVVYAQGEQPEADPSFGS